MEDGERLDLPILDGFPEETAGPSYWRSLNDWAQSESDRKHVDHEFQNGQWSLPSGVNRRAFIKTLGASMALAGLTGCITRQPEEKIVPYVRPPEEEVPGKPLFFATAMPLGGYGRGVLVESHEGRPTKIEGNPDHPDSFGATDVFAQASLLGLYDPDRSKEIVNGDRILTWDLFIARFEEEVRRLRSNGGAGLRVLTGPVTSPTLADQLERLLADYPDARLHQYEPVFEPPARVVPSRTDSPASAAAEVPRYHFDRAEVVVSIDADFLGPGPRQVLHARSFMQRRRIRNGSDAMNRLYVVESMPSMTGMTADHRLRLRPSRMERLAASLSRAVGLSAEASGGVEDDAWIAAAAADLLEHRGAGLVIAGDCQPPRVHAIVRRLNEALGNVGKTVEYAAPVTSRPEDPFASLRSLVRDMQAGAVDILVILGGNPVYDAPADVPFSDALGNVRLRIRHGLYEDETSALCDWHVPAAHYLESWGDIRSTRGEVGIIQPLIAPLYGGTSPLELVAVIRGMPGSASYDLVREFWAGRVRGDFEAFWQDALNRGLVVQRSESSPEADAYALEEVGLEAGGTLSALVTPAVVDASERQSPTSADEGPADGALELHIRPSPSVWDGRFANNGWLQELPQPVTKLTWDNAACLSPKTARDLDLENRDVVRLAFGGRSVEAPVLIVAGHAERTVTVHLGYGRTRAGRVGTGVGFNAYRIRRSDAPWGGPGLSIEKTGKQHVLAVTEHQNDMHGRHLIIEGTLDAYRKTPDFAQSLSDAPEEDESLYPKYEYDGYKWGMAIDLTTCIGCNACVIACQAENNIPVVGKEQVLAGRAMHWIRIDRYYRGDAAEPEMVVQPVPCMHCENAPCEVVCPVAATVHDSEGLNVMVYNRCVGTRYCSNNCPYKVRRFNFLPYARIKDESLKLMQNPDVTIRYRGVMEKCSYCIQRISGARIEAKKQDRRIRDGEVVTACQQVCPTEAIVFGDLNDPDALVNEAKASPLNYGLLAELNTRPRTTYLARVRNPRQPLASEDNPET